MLRIARNWVMLAAPQHATALGSNRNRLFLHSICPFREMGLGMRGTIRWGAHAPEAQRCPHSQAARLPWAPLSALRPAHPTPLWRKGPEQQHSMGPLALHEADPGLIPGIPACQE